MGNAAPITSAFGADSTAREVVAGIDLRGKNAIVTGGGSGLGLETTRALALAGAHVTIAVRDTAAGQAVADKINEEAGRAAVDVAFLDLTDLSSVRALAQTWGAKPLHILVNNAGVMATPEGRTKDGFETQFGVNHLAHFLLTTLLLPALEAGAPSRVVALSSSAHVFSDVDLDDPNFEKSPYHPMKSYGRAKTANALFVVEFDRRYRQKDIHAFAVMPGVIRTALGRYLPDNVWDSLGDSVKFKSHEQGAATSVWAATSPDLAQTGGLYLEDCKVADVTQGRAGAGKGVMPYAVDPERARALWTLSEQMLAKV